MIFREIDSKPAFDVDTVLLFLNELRQDPNAAGFNSPVDWRLLNMPTYP